MLLHSPKDRIETFYRVVYSFRDEYGALNQNTRYISDRRCDHSIDKDTALVYYGGTNLVAYP